MENTNAHKIASGQDVFLDPVGAAQFLRYKLSYIYQLTFERKIPFYKKGRRIYFSQSELAQWLLEGRVMTATDLDREAQLR